MIKKITTLLLLILLSGCFAEDNKTDTNTTSLHPEKKEASLFTLTTIEGSTIHIDESKEGLNFKEFQDKVVLFIFFGYRCPPCLKEIPLLTELTNKKLKDLEIIAMEVQGLNEKRLKAFAERSGANYNLISSDGNRPFIDYIIQRANWQGSIPFLLGFDKEGTVKIVHTGGVNREQFDKIYTALSQESNSTE